MKDTQPAWEWILHLLSSSVTHWRTPDLLYRDGERREKGHLMGRMDGEGDSTGRRARGRSSRQLLGHCLPGVCSSVISQPLPSLASYRHTHAHTHRFRFVQLLPSPVSLSASSVLRISGAGQIHWGSDFIYRYSDLMPASPSRFLVSLWWIMSGAAGWKCHSENLAGRNEIPCSLVPWL